MSIQKLIFPLKEVVTHDQLSEILQILAYLDEFQKPKETLKSSQPLYRSGCVPHHSECGSLH
jgi:hypothetical protein